MEFTKEQNRALCEKYPFLDPDRRWGRKNCPDRDEHMPLSPEGAQEWDYRYTELDSMPDGWRIGFGEQLCEELKAELERAGLLDQYRILQIKEKYGSLRWYDSGNTSAGYDILEKYERISARTCICCGKPATRITSGWISPYCDACCPEEASVPIDQYNKEALVDVLL